MCGNSSTPESEDEGPAQKRIKSEVPDLGLPQNHPNVNAVGLVENGLQYTKSAISNIKRQSVSAIAPKKIDTVTKSVTNKIRRHHRDLI